MLLCCVFVVKGQEDKEIVPASESAVRHEVTLNFEPVSSGPKRLRAKTSDGAVVKVGGNYERVENRIHQLFSAGRYGEELFNMVIDENGYYDFGTYSDNRIVTENDVAFRYSLYGTAMAGIQLFIGPVLSIEAAGVYHHMLYNNIPEGNGGDF